jgi:hypothetical protein
MLYAVRTYLVRAANDMQLVCCGIVMIQHRSFCSIRLRHTHTIYLVRGEMLVGVNITLLKSCVEMQY